MSAGRQIETILANPPDYFRSIQERATKRWDQLEADPELAGPWHQLFKQVQSPRHILSELLQNADDAGASEARVSIENDRFVFEHNGEDFIEAHFASICRFGYSNKRALHTIGFRGIGFKSTFSLGDRVELFTPTLAVAFERARFTEPHWIDSRYQTSGTTRVEVAIANPLLRREVEKNLDEWLKSPVSLLFFKKIRRLRIGDSEVHWQSLGPGPIAESEWMALDEKANDPFLLVRSAEEAFPDEALDEIDLGPREITDRNKTIFTAQFHIHHQREVFVGSEVYSTLRIIDFDDKRMHYLQELHHADEHWVSAIAQTLVLHVDLGRRKVEPWPDDIREKIVALHARHAELPPHPMVGAVLSIARK